MAFFKKNTEQPEKLKDILFLCYQTYKKGVFVKSSFFVLIIIVAFLNIAYSSFDDPLSNDHIAIINISGNITESNPAGNGFTFAKNLNKAIESENAKAIIILADSNGGSPVQSETMYKAMINSLPKTNKEVVVSIKTSCASACYMAIAPADKIYAHSMSLVGSIGVRMDTWNFSKALDTHGVERVSIYKGEDKALLDPYSPKNEEQIKKVNELLLTPLYEEFKNYVITARGNKLTDRVNLFSGFMWTGAAAVDLGLADEVKTTFEVIEDLKGKYNVEHIEYYGHKKFSLSRAFSLEGQEQFINMLVDSIAEKVMSQTTSITF